jgi:hypothetical protein
MLKQIVQKEQAVAFTVNIEGTSAAAAPSNLIQRLESSTKSDPISREALLTKLARADQKRKEQLLRKDGVTDKKLKAASDRRNFIAEGGINIQLKERCSRQEKQAAENRRVLAERQLQRVRNHINHVEEVCRGVAVRRSQSRD